MSDSESHPETPTMPSVIDLFGKPVTPKTDVEIDTRSRLLDKTFDDINLDSKFDLSVSNENRFLFLFSRANSYAEIIKLRYGSNILMDFFYKYKKQSMSKGRISRQEMVDIISGRNFPDFDDIKTEYQSSSILDRMRGVIRR